MSTDAEHLYLAHIERATRLAYLATGDRDAAQDIGQDALLRCLRRVAAVRRPEAFGAYVDRAVSRAVIDRHRSESRRQKREQVYAHRQPAAQPDAHLGVDDRSLLYPALESLSGDQRLTVVLRYWADLSDQGIAAAMNCSVGTVKSRLSRSLRIIEGVLHEPVDHA